MDCENKYETEQMCVFCSSKNIIERQHRGMFTQGINASRTIALWVEYPFLECDDCGESWTDYRAEEARGKALERWLNRDIKGKVGDVDVE